MSNSSNSTADIEKQPTEYSCGPTALAYFLVLQGMTFSVPFLIESLKPTPELGTDPKAIESFLQSWDYHFEVREWPHSIPLRRSTLPLLVNVNYEHEGDHYMVITGMDNDHNVTLWDPYTAELRYYSLLDFMNIWYSPLKKLKNWCLFLT